MTQEALKLALEALEELNNTSSYWWHKVDEATVAKIDSAITAIKETLAQPEQEQEPVALRATTEKAVVILKTVTAGLESALAKTTTPPQRKPLTDEEIHSVRDSFGEDPVMLVAFARAIEAAHGIKELR